jgi:hypothetical protein
VVGCSTVLLRGVPVMRIALLLLFASLVTNCTGPVDLAKYRLTEPKQKVGNFSTSRRSLVKNVDYDGLIPVRVNRDVPTVDIGKSSVRDIGLARKEDDPNERVVRAAEKSDSGALRIRTTAMTTGQATSRPLSFVEKSAKDDKENQLLEQKTIICRGC